MDGRLKSLEIKGQELSENSCSQQCQERIDSVSWSLRTDIKEGKGDYEIKRIKIMYRSKYIF